MSRHASMIVRGIMAGVYLTMFGWVFFEFIHMGSDLPKSAESALGVLVGILGGGLNLILGYYFGSSQGSADKTAELTKR